MRTILTGLLMASLMITGLHAQVAFIEVVTAEEMEAAKKKASDGMQLLFVDVYATWCGPCKMMDRDIYPNPTVSEYMNEHFVNVRMDGETDFGRKYASEMQLTGFPTMYVFSDEGDFLTRIVGFKQADQLLLTLKGVVDNNAQLKRFRGAYAQGTIDMEDFADYINVLRKMGNDEKAEELAAEYVKKQMGENLSDYDIRAVAFYTDLTDLWWPQFVTENERVQMALGEDYIPALEKIYNNSLIIAVDSNDIELISRIAHELSPLVESMQASDRDMRTMPFLQYYYYTDQNEELMAYVDKRFASDRKGDHHWLFGAASQIVDMDQQHQTPILLEKGEEWFGICISLEEQFDYYFYYGMVLLFQKKTTESRASFEKASSMAKTTEQMQMVQQVMDYLNRMR